MIRERIRASLLRRVRNRCLFTFLMVVFIPSGGSAIAAERAADDADAEHQSGLVEETSTSSQFGFDSASSVEGTLAETDERQREGPLERFRARKDALEAGTGLSYGLDNFTQYLGTDSDESPSDAASNVFRFYGSWTVTGRDTPDSGALIFKIEDRSSIGNRPSPQALGPSLGYAGLFSSTFSDAGVVLTNFYWRQRFAAGRGAFVVGQVDPSDYVSVNSIASPWTGFTNLAFEQQPTVPIPSQGLGAAVLWQLDDNWGLLAGLTDANGDPSDPFDSAKNLFDEGELFKHIAVGWAPDWADRYDQTVQLTLWQADERVEAGVEEGHGVAFLTSARINNWRPFLRIGYAKDAGVLNDRSISIGTGYDARGGNDLAGLAVGWARAPDSSRDQYTLEAFYRYDMTDFLQVTPEIQYVVNPAFDPETDEILVLGLRLRIFF
jgi:porin